MSFYPSWLKVVWSGTYLTLRVQVHVWTCARGGRMHLIASWGKTRVDISTYPRVCPTGRQVYRPLLRGDAGDPIELSRPPSPRPPNAFTIPSFAATHSCKHSAVGAAAVVAPAIPSPKNRRDFAAQLMLLLFAA